MIKLPYYVNLLIIVVIILACIILFKVKTWGGYVVLLFFLMYPVVTFFNMLRLETYESILLSFPLTVGIFPTIVFFIGQLVPLTISIAMSSAVWIILWVAIDIMLSIHNSHELDRSVRS